MNDAEVKLQVKIDDSTANKSMDTLSKKTDNLSKSFTNAGKKLTAGLTLPIVGLIGVGVKYNATVEDLTTSFKVMTGSAEKAGDIVERLKDIGSKTPFEFTDLAETTKLLMNYGLTADDAISKMEMLGDISQGNADKMNRISMAYGQMSSAGKVNLQDVKQMIEAGFNPLKEISESTGESMSSLYDRISKGSISVDEITASMKRSTSQGGKYFGSMEQQSQTTTGKLSTLKDEFLSATGSLTESLIPAFKSGVEWLTKLSNWFSSLSEDQRKMILTVMGILAVLGPLLLIIGQIIQVVKLASIVFAFLASPIGLIVLGIAALVAVIVLVITHFEEVKEVAGNVLNAIMGFFGGIGQWFSDVFSTAFNGITTAFGGMLDFFSGILQGIKNIFGGIANWFKNIFTGAWTAVKNVFSTGGAIFVGIKDGIVNAFRTIVNGIIGGINKVIAVPFNGINGFLKGIKGIDIFGIKPFNWVSTIKVPQIPKLVVGTNYVAQEGLAYLHQGEAVVPKKYNPAIGGGNNQPITLNAMIEAKVNEGTLFEANTRINYNKSLQTGFGG